MNHPTSSRTLSQLPATVCEPDHTRKSPAAAGRVFEVENWMLASLVRLQEAPLSLAKLTKRLTSRTLHHLASLDQTEEGPV